MPAIGRKTSKKGGCVAGRIVVQRERADRSRVGPGLHLSLICKKTKAKRVSLLLPRVWIVIRIGFFAGLRMSVATRRSSDRRELFGVLFVLPKLW